MAISAQKVRSAEPSSKVVLALAGGMLAILCVLVLLAAAMNGGGATTRSASQGQPAAVSVGQGAGDHARSEKQAGGDSGQSDPGTTNGLLP